MSVSLEKVFDFNEADFRLNQNGQLSEKQIATLNAYRRMSGFFGKLAFVVMFLSFGSISAIALYNIGIDWEKNPAPIVAYAAFFLGSLLIFIIAVVIGNLRSDLKSGKISTIEGFAEKSEKKLPLQIGTAYYAKIDNVKFQLDTKSKYQALQPNIRYRVFYIKRPPVHIILSIAETLVESV